MQVNIQIPDGVQPGGYVPIVVQVGDTSTTPRSVWIPRIGECRGGMMFQKQDSSSDLS